MGWLPFQKAKMWLSAARQAIIRHPLSSNTLDAHTQPSQTTPSECRMKSCLFLYFHGLALTSDPLSLQAQRVEDKLFANLWLIFMYLCTAQHDVHLWERSMYEGIAHAMGFC